MKYDVELFMADIENLFKNNLNAKITAINSEKSDTIVLEAVDALAYGNDVDERIFNFDPFMLTSVVDIQGEGQGPFTSKTIIMNISLILFDSSQDAFIMKRMLRYQRCLEEIIENNFYGKTSASIIKLEHLPVMSWVKSGSSQIYKIASINIISSFA